MRKIFFLLLSLIAVSSWYFFSGTSLLSRTLTPPRKETMVRPSTPTTEAPITRPVIESSSRVETSGEPDLAAKCFEPTTAPGTCEIGTVSGKIDPLVRQPGAFIWVCRTKKSATLCKYFPDASGCGNGIIEKKKGEECDDGNTSDLDACDSSCKKIFCGNGRVEENHGEECDDGNRTPWDGCGSYCSKEEDTCGNGTLESGEECEEGVACKMSHKCDSCRCRLNIDWNIQKVDLIGGDQGIGIKFTIPLP